MSPVPGAVQDLRTPPAVTVGPRAPVRLGTRDAARVLGTVLAPLVAQGPILRRSAVVALGERLGADERAVALLHELGERSAHRPLLLRLGPHDLLLPLHPDDARAVLDLSPEPFAAASREKRAALRQLEPRAVLVAPARARPPLRAWNEAALEHGRPVHGAADELDAVLDADARAIVARGLDGTVGFADVDALLWATVRTVVLGPGARDDTALTDDLQRLRARANWSFLAPLDRTRRIRLAHRLAAHVERAPRGSLAGYGRGLRGADDATVTGQVPHWLFAFDAARITLWRALAVVAARADLQSRLRAEAAGGGLRELPLARDTVLETVRVWPTTLVILRESTAATRWGGHEVGPGATLALVSAFLHRDPRSPAASGFHPGTAPAGLLTVPFSAGPVACPGRDVVLHTVSTLLSRLVREARWQPVSHPGLAHDPLPGGLDHHHLRVRASLL